MPSFHRATRHANASPTAGKAAFWDRIARKYAADPIADPEGYEATLRRVLALLSPKDAVLEIGCGTGTTAMRLAPASGRYFATDLSATMVQIAREKLAAQPIAQLEFAQADADAAPPGPGTWDAVLAFNLLHLVADLDAALAHAAQALRPGGLLVCKTPCVAEMHPLIARVAVPLMRVIGKAPHVLLFDAGQLQAAMVRQGLVLAAVERHGTRGKDIRVFTVARKPA